MRMFLFMGLLLFFFTTVHAQQVISSSGEVFKNETSSIAFTVGEPISNTFVSNDLILTQGFHQTLITITSIWENPDYPLQISVYPNPTSDFVIVKNAITKQGNLNYQVISDKGEILLQGQLTEEETNIDFSQLQPAIYLLKTYSQNKLAKTIKIIKNETL